MHKIHNKTGEFHIHPPSSIALRLTETFFNLTVGVGNLHYEIFQKEKLIYLFLAESLYRLWKPYF